MSVMGHDGPSLPFDFKFPFQNKSILIESNLINKDLGLRHNDARGWGWGVGLFLMTF